MSWFIKPAHHLFECLGNCVASLVCCAHQLQLNEFLIMTMSLKVGSNLLEKHWLGVQWDEIGHRHHQDQVHVSLNLSIAEMS